jgi:hypothetical protein
MREHHLLQGFGFHQVQLGSKFYLLLPKLNELQLRAIGRRLAERGFAVETGSSLKATSRKAALYVNPVGYCWSSVDPADAIAPSIPQLLRAPKQKASVSELASRYFDVQTDGSSASVRLSTRMESSTLWHGLRADGLVALTPDERAVVSFLVGASGGCELLTDFPRLGSRVRIIGRRQYYESRLGPAEAKSTLRALGERGLRNSYLPERGVLVFDSFSLPSRKELARVFESLGEWCYFSPS